MTYYFLYIIGAHAKSVQGNSPTEPNTDVKCSIDAADSRLERGMTTNDSRLEMNKNSINSGLDFKLSTLDPRLIGLHPALNNHYLLDYDLIPFDDPKKMEGLILAMQTGWFKYMEVAGMWFATFETNMTAVSELFRKEYKPGEAMFVCVPVIMNSGTIAMMKCGNYTETQLQRTIQQFSFSYQYNTYKVQILISAVVDCIIIIIGILGKHIPSNCN